MLLPPEKWQRQYAGEARIGVALIAGLRCKTWKNPYHTRFRIGRRVPCGDTGKTLPDPGRRQRRASIHRFGEAFHGGFRCGDCRT